jgi:hypothetical protein
MLEAGDFPQTQWLIETLWNRLTGRLEGRPLAERQLVNRSAKPWHGSLVLRVTEDEVVSDEQRGPDPSDQ